MPFNLRTGSNTVTELHFAVLGVTVNAWYVHLRQQVPCKEVVCTENKPRGISQVI